MVYMHLNFDRNIRYRTFSIALKLALLPFVVKADPTPGSLATTELLSSKTDLPFPDFYIKIKNDFFFNFGWDCISSIAAS